ncbi:MAG: hypothetical protein AAGU73_08765 [Actinomycetota bacterium]
MGVSRTPRYSVALVERLVRDGRVLTTARVTQWLTNHDYDAKQEIMQVLLSVHEHGRFTGSCVLMNGEVADEYIVGVSGEDWYLKFWVDEEQLFVDVWSCCWDGAIH